MWITRFLEYLPAGPLVRVEDDLSWVDQIHDYVVEDDGE